MDDLKMWEKLRDVPTGVMLDVILNRAQLAGNNRVLKDGVQAFHWQWCRMLEGSVVALLQALPQSILIMTDNDLPRPDTNQNHLRRLMEMEPIPQKPSVIEINQRHREEDEREETMYKDAIEVVHIKFDPSNPTWWRSRDEWVKDRTALWRERYPTAREQRRLRVRTYGELRTDEFGKTWFHIDLVLERSGSDLISL